MKLTLSILGALVALLVAGWALGWVNVGGQTASAENVRQQWAEAYRSHESLQAIGANICRARTLAEASTSDSERIQRQTQVVAQEQNYERVAAQYDAQMADGFRAKYVKPGDLPERAASLDAATSACA